VHLVDELAGLVASDGCGGCASVQLGALRIGGEGLRVGVWVCEWLSG